MKTNFSVSILLVLGIWMFVKYDFDTYIMPATALLPNGGRYYGDLKDKQFSGAGKIVWANGANYHGQFKQGLYSGIGKLQNVVGNTYEGEFIEGNLTGQGTLITKAGNVYKGQFKNFSFDGYGRWEFDQGSSYVGDFKVGQYHGAGTLNIENGQSIYVGSFDNGQYHGEGHIKYSSGISYRGQFSEGLFHGHGIYKDAKGERFEGEFVKSEFTGLGVFENSAESRYEGEFKNWVFEGEGKWIGAKGREYKGQFVTGMLTGEGSFKDSDGQSYQGQFKEWRFHGKGLLSKPNGDQYQGQFKYGLSNGLGTLTYATPKKDEAELSGYWKRGKYIGEENGPDPRTINTEKALYNQNKLIKTTLENIALSEKEKINMYFLAIAGDGKQDVFYKEVSTVRTLFDQSFATQDRSAVLINNSKTVDSIALATNTAIEKVMLGISKKMDSNNDILFVYLSSHGSKDHQFELDQEGLSLNNLSAKHLAKIIKKLPIKWKVIVISSCYAGGFIPELKDNNSMIITASAHDRTSFGCSDDADMTYFGRAFFDALEESSSFEATFEKAKELVKQREIEYIKKEGSDDKHSNPQISKPKSISNHLKRWWKQIELSS